MKKLLLTLIVSLAFCGSIFAQSSHWPEFNGNAFMLQSPLVAFVQIDGVFVEVGDNWADLEVAPFVGTECRGHQFMDDFTADGDPHPILELSVYYTTAGDAVTFEMYDHANNIEYKDCTCNIAVTTGDPHVELYMDYDQAVILNFTSPSTTLNDITWNVGGDWPGGSVPTGNVTIPDNTVVTIPAGYTANASDITIGSGSSIVIEDGGQLIHSTEIPVTMQLDVTTYAKSTNGYRMIAAPVSEIAGGTTLPVATELVTGTFDLYYFDQNEDLQWRNYEATPFVFEIGKGYLYANNTTATIDAFTGYAKPTGTDVNVDLDYTDGKPFAGWNLVGNPYTCKAYSTKSFYRLNTAGSGLATEPVTAGTEIATLEGIFVKADAAGTQCTFSTTTSKSAPSLNINVSQANAMVDKAIVCFGSGDALEKFQLDPNHTKVYMPVEGRDYAVVSTGNQGEMPVSFKAESNGTYSLDFSSEDTEFSYLHLIDNMTGNDVDLLQTPSYSFNAQTTDYASRFRLVFATGTAGVDNFGFVCDGSIIINGNNGGTVQVIDALGRILVSENGVNSVSTSGMVPGVYVLRLINGNDVKTQKIVVK